MGRQIILKDNGKYAIFSTVVDDFLLDEATEEEVIEFFIEDAKDTVIHRISSLIDALKMGKNPYFQFKLTYNEAKKLLEMQYNV